MGSQKDALIVFSKKNKQAFLVSLDVLRDSLALGLLDFSTTAAKRSHDPSAKNNKGILESVRGDLVPEYEKVAYSLEICVIIVK